MEKKWDTGNPEDLQRLFVNGTLITKGLTLIIQDILGSLKLFKGTLNSKKVGGVDLLAGIDAEEKDKWKCENTLSCQTAEKSDIRTSSVTDKICMRSSFLQAKDACEIFIRGASRGMNQRALDAE